VIDITRKFCIKMYLFQHRTGVDMLINELHAMQRLEHSFIIRLHFAFQDRQSCFLVLDLKTGGDLRHYLRKRIVFDEDDVAFYIACISTALDHIHSRRIIHRDVKPGTATVRFNYAYWSDCFLTVKQRTLS
jgi:serine/threonine protein kinase